MTTPPTVQTIIQHHLRALAEQDDASEAQQQRDTAIRTLLEAEDCPRCGGQGEVPTGVTLDFDSGMYEADDCKPCPDCAGTGKPPRAATIAQLVTDASPIDPETNKPRGLSRERIRQIKDSTR